MEASRDVDGRWLVYSRGVHFFAFGWEWDIGFWYFNRWR